MNPRTREEWLEQAMQMMWPLFPAGDAPAVKVSVGWPKGARAPRGGQVVGQCWGQDSSVDGHSRHVFICPTVEDPKRVLPILLHEMVHARVGVEHKHKRPFIEVARHVGLVKPWTATSPSDALAEHFVELAGVLGSYPHVGMILPRKKQTTRQKLWMCGHGKKVRAADSDPLNALCKTCGTAFERVESGGDDETED